MSWPGCGMDGTPCAAVAHVRDNGSGHELVRRPPAGYPHRLAMFHLMNLYPEPISKLIYRNIRSGLFKNFYQSEEEFPVFLIHGQVCNEISSAVVTPFWLIRFI